MQQTDRQVGLAAAAELLPWQEAGGQRLESQYSTRWRLQVEVRRRRRVGRRTSRRKDSGLLQVNQTIQDNTKRKACKTADRTAEI